MTTNSQELAEKLARKCACSIPPDVLEHPMPFPARLDYASKQIFRFTALLEFIQLREAISDLLTKETEPSEVYKALSALDLKLKAILGE